MIPKDLSAAMISALFVMFVFSAAESARRRGVSRATTRKIVHIGIGSWVIPTMLLFEHRIWAVLPAASFVLFNAYSYRTGLVKSMEGEERNIGTILYPFSVALLLFLTFDSPLRAVGAAGVLVMTYGDAAASLIGRRFGKHVYRVAGHPRSIEGSLAMLLSSWVAILIAFTMLGPAPTSGLLIAAAIAALVATSLEAVSLWGVDNLLVPMSAALTLYLCRGGLWP